MQQFCDNLLFQKKEECLSFIDLKKINILKKDHQSPGHVGLEGEDGFVGEDLDLGWW